MKATLYILSAVIASAGLVLIWHNSSFLVAFGVWLVIAGKLLLENAQIHQSKTP